MARSQLNKDLKFSRRLNCIVDPKYLLLEIKFNNSKCDACYKEVTSLPYISRAIYAHRIYHIRCAYNLNLLTDRQFIMINKLPIIELKIEVLENNSSGINETNI